MAQENYKNNLVDTSWICGCGSLNAGYKDDASQLRYKKGVIVKIGTDVTAIDEGSEIYYDKRAGYTMLIDSVSHTVIQENDVVLVL